jgi:hypothetical protein
MAYGDTFHPAGAQRDIKVRGPIWAGAWSITGVYAIYWIIVTARDLSEYGKAKGRDLGQNPTNTLLAVLIGWIIIIPPLVAIYRQAKRIQQAQQMNGIEPFNGWLALVFYIVFSPIYFGYVQSELNKVWAAEGGPVPDTTLQPAPALDSAPQGDPLTTTTQAPEQTQAPEAPERPAG